MLGGQHGRWGPAFQRKVSFPSGSQSAASPHSFTKFLPSQFTRGQTLCSSGTDGLLLPHCLSVYRNVGGRRFVPGANAATQCAPAEPGAGGCLCRRGFTGSFPGRRNTGVSKPALPFSQFQWCLGVALGQSVQNLGRSLKSHAVESRGPAGRGARAACVLGTLCLSRFPPTRRGLARSGRTADARASGAPARKRGSKAHSGLF